MLCLDGKRGSGLSAASSSVPSTRVPLSALVCVPEGLAMGGARITVVARGTGDAILAHRCLHNAHCTHSGASVRTDATVGHEITAGVDEP